MIKTMNAFKCANEIFIFVCACGMINIFVLNFGFQPVAECF